MTEKRKRVAANELDEVFDALVQAIPPERYGEMRAVLREALVRTSRKAAMARPPAPTQDDVAPEAETPSHHAPPASAPPITRTRHPHRRRRHPRGPPRRRRAKPLPLSRLRRE